MIRPFTCLSLAMALGSGLYLYSEKHRTTLLDQRIRAVAVETTLIRDRTSMLRAEWALLNQPDRLQALAARFLPALQPVAPTQFVQMSALEQRLPAILPPAPPAPPAPAPTITVPNAAAAPAAPATPAPALLADAGRAAPAASDPDDDPDDDAPKGPAAKVAPARAASRPAAVAAASRAATVRLAAAHPPHAASVARHAAPTRLAASGIAPPIGANSMVHEISSYGRPNTILAGAWRPAPIAAPAFTGSALGMAHVAMAPPMAAPAAR